MSKTLITDDRAAEISRLHSEILESLQSNLVKAMRVGELLVEQKAGLPHGQFLPWIKANLSFTDRTARNYMHLYRHRNRLKTETISDLGTAYRFLQSDSRADRRQKQEQGIQADENITEVQAESLQAVGGPEIIPPPGISRIWTLEQETFTEHFVIEPHEQEGYFFTTYVQIGEDGAVAEGDRRGLNRRFIHIRVKGQNSVRLITFGTFAEVECEPLNYNRWLYESCEEYLQQQREAWSCEHAPDETGFCSSCGSLHNE